MFFRIIFFILGVSTIFSTEATVDQYASHSKDAIPSWVKLYDFSLDPVPVKPSQINLQYLLIDTQRNWEEKTLYQHFAVKTLTQSGIENISQLQIDFDPSYTQIVMHTLRVFRDGEWFDRLEDTRYNLVQRETDLEKKLYNGSLTLIYFLGDIREGDIIEYSYSLKGSRPFFSSHYTDRVYLQREFSVEKITHRLLGSPDLSFLIKPINTAIEPTILDLSPNLREWSWETSNTSPYTCEANEPIWHNPPAYIDMSQYQTWEEVAEKYYLLHALPSDFAQSVPSEMKDLVEHWKNSASETSKRALLATRFVQDQIRYLGIEENMGAFQPTDPLLTFQRRFGDCKDKTFLLHALLQLMDIPSSPLLVHTSRGKRLREVLPNPFVFDHLVLQLEIDGKSYYVDPTISLQGGSLQTTFFPDYVWGLLLSKDSKGLIPLPEETFKHPSEIDTTITLESENMAHLKIKSVFYDSRADRLRRSLKWKGLKKLEEDFLAPLQETYGTVTSDAPLEVLDDQENNIMTFIESYHLPTQELKDRKVMEIYSFTLKDYLRSRLNPERRSPYAIPYPSWVKERIHIKNPFAQWNPSQETYAPEHDSIFYTLSTQIEENCATFIFELKHLQDHIPKESLRDYWALVNDINRKAPPKMDIAFLPTFKKEERFPGSYAIFALILWPLLNLISRRKRSVQELLSLQLSKFQRGYLVITGLSVIFMSASPASAVFITVGIAIATNILCNYMFSKQSVKIAFFAQTFLCLQGFFLLCLILSMSDLQLSEKILAYAVCSLYLGQSFFTLKKVKSLLCVANIGVHPQTSVPQKSES